MVSSPAGTSRTGPSMKRRGSRGAAADEEARFTPVTGSAIFTQGAALMAFAPSENHA